MERPGPEGGALGSGGGLPGGSRPLNWVLKGEQGLKGGGRDFVSRRDEPWCRSGRIPFPFYG